MLLCCPERFAVLPLFRVCKAFIPFHCQVGLHCLGLQHFALHLSVHGPLSGFHFWGIVGNAAMTVVY